VDLVSRYERVRNATRALAAPLSAEDCSAQSMEDASPTKWHLAHTTWFFEIFVLEPEDPGYPTFEPSYRRLFNSYYNAVGEQHPRPRRGLLTRPSLERVLEYRAHVDAHMLESLRTNAPDTGLLRLGLEHEQQHQELVLTDLKHLLACNPTHPVYRECAAAAGGEPKPLAWHHHPGGVCWLGTDDRDSSFDNEGPRHRALLEPFELANRLVTNAEFTAFMGDDGYRRPELWLSDGWSTVCERGWNAPLYWERIDGAWQVQTLAGLRPLADNEPVCHVSYYEADAYARWAAGRLPTEAEWEVVAADSPVVGNFAESGLLHPSPVDPGRLGDWPAQLFGDVWEWTASPYAAYPGYRPPEGAVGEYNGKFMCNQLVLRGGSCATPRDLARASYRNFFYPDARWQFSGVRLARDAR
jgi:ergothioneine biosynthesis protein EgtB